MEFNDIKVQQKILRKKINYNINKVLDHGRYILGPENIDLEKKLSRYVNTKNSLTVSSGTDALLISLMAIGIKEGDEVITTAFSYISTIEVIVTLKAIPIMIDIRQDDCNLDENLILENISTRTKAIIAVGLFGQVANMDKINTIVKKSNKNIIIIEDAAQSFGSQLNDKKSCSLSNIGCTSFFPSKPLGCYGDGGAIFTNDNNLYKKMKSIRSHGQSNKKYYHEMIGLSGRMDTIQAAIILAKLSIFDKEIKLRNKIAKIYDKFFDNIGMKRILVSKTKQSVYAQYCIFPKNRNNLMNYLNRNNIPTNIYYPMPMHFQKPYLKFKTKNTPNAQLISKSILAIPMSPYLKEEDQIKICEIVQLNKNK